MYDLPYFLTDNIYPRWRIFQRTFKGDKNKMLKAFANYARKHEAVRKDIERLFGVLQKRFHVLFHPSRHWSKDMMSIVVATCLILHNMIVEDEYGESIASDTEYERRQNRIEVACLSISQPLDARSSQPPSDPDAEFVLPGYDMHGFASRASAVRDEANHFQLQRDLINHLWTMKARERHL